MIQQVVNVAGSLLKMWMGGKKKNTFVGRQHELRCRLTCPGALQMATKTSQEPSFQAGLELDIY